MDTLESRTLFSGDVEISEFMASNTKSLADQDGAFSDWIEVHNTTAAPVSLQGWHLTDDKSLPAKWTFPAVTLPANGYLVVFASGKDRAVAGGQLHTNFSLAAGGEYLALVPPGAGAEPATVLDPYPRQQPDVSFGYGPPARVNTALVSTPAPAKYYVPGAAGVDGWAATEFDDSAWLGGQTGIGYEVATGSQPPLPVELEPNDVAAAADDASANFGPVAADAAQGGQYQIDVKGALDAAGDVDFFNLGALQPGDRLSVSLSGVASSRGTLNDPYLEVYRLNGGTPEFVTSSDDDGPGYDALLHRFTVRADDTYYAKAMSYPGLGLVGTYELGVFLEDVAGSAAPLTGAAPAADAGPNDDVAAATDASAGWRRVGYRSSTAGQISPAGDADVYRFQFTAGDVVTLIADSTSTLDARVSLLGPDGITVVASEDGSSSGLDDAESARDSRLYSYTVPAGGNYFVRVQGGTGSSGAYRLEVGLSTATAPPTAAWFSGLVATNVGGLMRGVSPGAFVRVPFAIDTDAALSDIETLTLAMKYDDGFVAYLNGTEVARRNAPAGDAAAAWDAAATTARDNVTAASFETIDLSGFRDGLAVGTNVLAVHGLNRSADDADFLVLPELRAVSPLRQVAPGYFAAPTPGKVNGPLGSLGTVADTRFDHDRGFYDQPFDLAITTATPGAEIRYTLNGDAPTATTGAVYAGPIRIDKTTTIRAMAFKPGFYSTNVDTQTFLFLDDVVRQSPNGAAPAGWPTSWGANARDYGMDPDVVNNAQYRDTIKDDLQTLPTMSLVMDLDDLFNPSNGIYANPGQDGIAWERRASLELINPDGTKGFQADAGVRIRGGFSRSTANPKHALRFFFRSEYGQNSLDYPLFGPDAAQSFKGFDLRTFQNYSWSFQGDARGIFMRDQLSRDLQLATGQPATHGNYYHLYINGQYWGLYNTDERPEANYGASYFGGKAADYDTIKVDPDLGYSVEATDGDMQAWTSLWTQLHSGPVDDALYQRLQGNDPDGTPNPALPVLLDMDNLIDYSLVIDYGGNLDAPVSAFINNNGRPNNFFALRNRTPGARQGFRFFVHDAEHTLLSVSENRTGPFPAGNDLATSNPQYFFQRLWASPGFKMRVADHIQKHMVDPGGALTPAKVRESLLRRAAEIDRAVVAESARWGDSKAPAAPFTRNSNWLTEVNRILNSYIPQRTNIVLGQLKTDGLYPAFGAPVFNPRGGTVAPGFPLLITLAPGTPATGTIYYTVDGSDPRLPGGAVNPDAVAYTGTVPIDAAMTVKARVLNGTTWSPLAESTFALDTVPLRVTELMYNPAPPPEGSPFLRQDFEFVELQNVGTTELDLSGVRFSDGIGYTFLDGTTLAPGAYAVVARNAEAFASRYGDGVPVGVFTGGLSDSGERVVLSGPGPGIGGSGGPTLLAFTYSDAWQPVTDGGGRSLVPRSPRLPPEAWNDPNAWRRSAAEGGSPGAADPVLPTTVAGRWLFYNRSGYDGTVAPSPDSSDDNARADKVALRPGDARATIANVSSYSRGINGLFIDFADLAPGLTLGTGDVEFKVGRGGNPAGWAAGPAPAVMALRRGAGVGGSDRLTVTFADNAIKNQWVQVTVKANGRTGLAADDVFYFGNLAGDVGDTAPGLALSRVNAVDMAQIKRFVPTAVAPANMRYDLDKDGRVNATDLAVIKANLFATLEMLDLSAPPAAARPAPAPAPPPFSSVPVSNTTGVVGSVDDDVLGAAPASVLA